ncbi:MAG: DUF262 domain-containing protein [Fusobacterium perfoetens]|uniref:DUF262 domain-containing protein n=1 Tax=Fusobacterium perfoetens TaxID=852 RepID=UPI0023F2F02E|nr:DUF262 domain-containing protein [Fusobacterium perfoetens]MCI6153384.1 DUF262 domain-containing protein [Fusobacterium perfoetens]MDY3238473.1 DUF262 domain-containing protein [Fusobacterium perfoetens]
MKKIENQMTFREMVLGDKIYVPTYQRAYSWEVIKNQNSNRKQVDTFLEDVKNHISNNNSSKFYLGNFLYEKKQGEYAIIDGQQRLTTIIILLSALEETLKEKFSIEELKVKNINFSTVEYDNEEFNKYIKNRIPEEENKKYKTESSRRFIEAYNYFKEELKKEEEKTLKEILETIENAKCTVDIIENEIEATQIFIFENNRGKAPTNLELTKTKLMYYVYSSVENENQKELLEEINEKFGIIYKNITKLERYIQEDTVLSIALRMYKKSLSIENVSIEIERILEDDKKEKEKEKENKNEKLKEFLGTLADTFEKISHFIELGLGTKETSDKEYDFLVHSLINLGISVKIYPIIIKALKNENYQERKKYLKL